MSTAPATRRTLNTPLTRTVELITRYAMAAGLRPSCQRPYRGVISLVVNGPGCGNVFGTIEIGTRTGRVLRASLHYGNHGRVEKFKYGRDVQKALKALTRVELEITPDQLRKGDVLTDSLAITSYMVSKTEPTTIALAGSTERIPGFWVYFDNDAIMKYAATELLRVDRLRSAP